VFTSSRRCNALAAPVMTTRFRGIPHGHANHAEIGVIVIENALSAGVLNFPCRDDD
jgi:hypothetical protein